MLFRECDHFLLSHGRAKETRRLHWNSHPVPNDRGLAFFLRPLPLSQREAIGELVVVWNLAATSFARVNSDQPCNLFPTLPPLLRRLPVVDPAIHRCSLPLEGTTAKSERLAWQRAVVDALVLKRSVPASAVRNSRHLWESAVDAPLLHYRDVIVGRRLFSARVGKQDRIWPVASLEHPKQDGGRVDPSAK